MFPFLLLFLSFLVTTALTPPLRRRLIARAVMDIPNNRSMHKTPVPRGGGWAVMTPVFLGLLFFHRDLFLLAPLGLLVFVSGWDDRKNLRASLRLAIHLLAAFLGSFALGEQALLFDGYLPLWLDRILLVIGWAWFMNLYNFMDGIDGITGTQTLCCATGILLLATLGGTLSADSLSLACLIIGSSAGFLVFNWPPAKIFLGDVGSVPLGFLIGFLLLQLATNGYLIPALLIPAYYLADSGITLIRRALKGEKIWQAHRQHFYQRATLGAGSPLPVLKGILLANGGLILSAFLALSSPWLGAVLGVNIILLLLARMSRNARNIF